MRMIDYMLIFLALFSAPGWQNGLDDFSHGLGSALLVLLLVGAIRAVRAEVNSVHRAPIPLRRDDR